MGSINISGEMNLIPLCFVLLSFVHVVHMSTSIGLWQAKKDCHEIYEDKTTPHCSTTEEKSCVDEYKEECNTEYDTECTEEYVTECKTDYTEECSTDYSNKCTTEFTKECQEEYVDECKTEQVKIPHESCRRIP